MGIRPNVKYIAREDRTILAMVSEGLGISLLPELMVRHSPTPIKVCHAPLHFYRTIGIGVKDKKRSFQLHPSVRGLCADVGSGKREYINVQLSLKSMRTRHVIQTRT